MTHDRKEQALAFLTGRTHGVLATVSPKGGPRARTVYYAANDRFEVFFLTLAGTRKVDDINHEHRAAFVVSDEGAPQTIQLEGTITEQPDAAADEPVVKALMDTLMSKGDTFAPVTRLDQENILFYKLTPTWVRFGDFTMGEGTDEVLATVVS